MKRVANLLGRLASLALPFFLGFTNSFLLIGPWFLRWEYNKPNFPPDRYGFTRQARLTLALPAVEFLASWERPEKAIRLLEEQTWDARPLYNQRELDHMVDTKRRTDIIRIMAWVTGVIVVGGTAVRAWRPEANDRTAAWRGLFNGAALTAVILGAISLYILVGWDSFFTRFHQLLFPPGTWTFAYSETLIRLFPEKLWFDVGLMLGVGTLIEAILIALVAYLLGRRAN